MCLAGWIVFDAIFLFGLNCLHSYARLCVSRQKAENEEHSSAQERGAPPTAAPRSHTQPAECTGLVPNTQQEEGYGQRLTPSHTLHCKEK